jgi:hypothetical protein
MEIDKTVTATISVDELRQLVTDYLYGQGIKAETIRFNVNGHNRPDDWRAEMSLDYRLDNVICTGQEIEKKK